MKKILPIFCFLSMIWGVAQARELGHYGPGIPNIRDLAVPPNPGFYYLQYNAFFSSDTYKDRNGNSANTLTVGPSTIQVDANVEIFAISPLFLFVTDTKILGGDYAFFISPLLTDSSVAATLSGLNRTGFFNSDNFGFGDLFVQPLWLGWRDKKYDLSFGLGAYMPVGEYDVDADDNLGLGFWTVQLQGAGYYYLDEQQASALMLSATYEMHSEKDGTDIIPGDHFTLEYGFSQYLSQRLEIGIAGYSQWQTEGDKGVSLLDPSVKTEVHGVGGQLSYWLTARFNLSLKYMKEYAAKARLAGEWTMLNITYLPVSLF